MPGFGVFTSYYIYIYILTSKDKTPKEDSGETPEVWFERHTLSKMISLYLSGVKLL